MDWVVYQSGREAVEAVLNEVAGPIWRRRNGQRVALAGQNLLFEEAKSLLSEAGYLVEESQHDVIRSAYKSPEAQQYGLHGAFGLILLLQGAGRSAATGQTSSANLDALNQLLRDPAVADAFRRFYGLPIGYNLADATIHRVGSTSLVLRCAAQASEIDSHRYLAVKCVLPAFFASRTVRERTRNYAKAHAVDIASAVEIYDSTERYIAMEFVPGQTLAEYLARFEVHEPEIRTDSSTREQASALAGAKRERRLDTEDLDRIRRIGLLICASLRELSARGRTHLDLAPTNIIVQEDHDGRIDRITLIDFGHNFTLTQRAGASRAFQQAVTYVDPFLVEHDPWATNWRSDAYSLGIILLEAASKRKLEPDTVLPALNRLWEGDLPLEGSPGLARIIEDLIDEDPDNRLLRAPHSDSGAEAYHHVRESLKLETGVLDIFESASGSPRYGLLRHVGLLRFGSWDQVRNLFGVKEDPAVVVHSEYERYPKLAWWAAAALTAWSLQLSAFVVLTLADVTLYGKPVHESGAVVGALVEHGAIHFKVGDFWGNLPGRAVALTFGIALVTYYINNYSVISPSMIDGRTARIAEAIMRITPLALFLPVLALIVWDPYAWALLAGCSTLIIVLNNFLSLRLAQRASYVGTRFSTCVGTGTRFIDEVYREWWILMGYYSLSLIFIGVIVQSSDSKFIRTAAVLVCLINLGKMYRLNCVRTAPQVRGNLLRAILTIQRAEEAEKRTLSGSIQGSGLSLTDG
jgi:serine/threonine protein kinase